MSVSEMNKKSREEEREGVLRLTPSSLLYLIFFRLLPTRKVLHCNPPFLVAS